MFFRSSVDKLAPLLYVLLTSKISLENPIINVNAMNINFYVQNTNNIHKHLLKTLKLPVTSKKKKRKKKAKLVQLNKDLKKQKYIYLYHFNSHLLCPDARQ